MKQSFRISPLVAVAISGLLTASGHSAVITNLALWLKADAGVTTSGSTVTSWADQVVGSTETAGNNGTGPQFVASAINGQAAIRFDGNDRLWNNRVGTSPITGNAMTVFVVARRIGAVANTSTAVFTQNGTPYDYNNTSNLVLAYEGPGTSLSTYRNGSLSNPGNPGNNNPYVFATVFDGSFNTAYLNGVAGATVASTGTFDFDHIVLGQRYENGFTNGYNGDIAELLVYDRALTAAEQNEVGFYLAQKYSLDTTYVPEPSSAVLLGFGGLALIIRRRK